MLRAKDVMQKHFVGVSKTTTIASALKLSSSAKVDLMPVLDDHKLCGVVVSKDLEGYKDTNATVGGIMRNPVFVDSDSGLDDATRTMIDHGIGRIPVVEDALTMTCIGILTATDIVKAVKKK